MTAKRALVVDDSRSARAFLSRILERHELEVDNAESAEEAIDYLKHKCPDVIFMDHLMPGMDGFQAVQVIKKDPRTATIPILMYTSQEGELYLSQARALGALGVLPKQTKPADVTKALYQLRLLADRRSAEGTDTTVVAPTPLQAVKVSADAAVSALPTQAMRDLHALPPEIRELIEALLRDQAVEMRRFVVENLESHADRIVGDVRLMLKDGATPPADLTPVQRQPSRTLGLAAAAAALAALLAVLWYRAVDDQRSLGARVSALQTQLDDARKAIEVATAVPISSPLTGDGATPIAGAGAGPGLVELVPFGEAPLSGMRVERVQAQLEKLIAQDFRGVVQLRSYPGRYCLAEVAGDSATPASADLPFTKCAQLGNPQEAMPTSQSQSVAFANMLLAEQRRANGTFEVQLSAGGIEDVVSSYPAITENLTAGEWNRIAALNNRVEMRWSPRP